MARVIVKKRLKLPAAKLKLDSKLPMGVKIKEYVSHDVGRVKTLTALAGIVKMAYVEAK